jgi:hypothetical protein
VSDPIAIAVTCALAEVSDAQKIITAQKRAAAKTVSAGPCASTSSSASGK